MYFILLLFLSHLSFISPLENGSRKCIMKECYDVIILRQYKLCVCAREETLIFWLSIKCKLYWHFGIDTFKSILSEVWILISACHAAYWLQSLRYILSAAIQNVLLCMTDFDVSVCLMCHLCLMHFAPIFSPIHCFCVHSGSSSSFYSAAHLFTSFHCRRAIFSRCSDVRILFIHFLLHRTRCVSMCDAIYRSKATEALCECDHIYYLDSL